MKRSKFRGLISTALAVVMASSVLAGCAGSGKSGGGKQAADNSNFEFKKDHLEFSWYADYNDMLANPWAVDSPTEEWIKQNLNVDIDYIPASGAAGQKLSIMLASNELPDVIQAGGSQTIKKMEDSKLLQPLDEYMDKYTNLRDTMGEKLLNMLRASDGHIYRISNWANYAGKPNGNVCWLVNEKVYKDLGEPALETFDDLYSFLKKVKTAYPDMVPLECSGQLEKYMYCGFKEEADVDDIVRFTTRKGNEMESLFKQDEYKKGMLLINKFYREGLLAKDIMARTSDQLEERIRAGRIAVLAADTGLGEKTRDDMMKYANSDWKVIWPIHEKGLDGKKIMLNAFGSVGFNSIMITKNAKNPEGIFAYLDWLWGAEGQAVYNYGPKGLYWDELNEDTYPILKPEYFRKSAADISKEIRGSGSGCRLGNTSWVDGCAKYVYDLTPENKRSWTKTQQFNIVWNTSKRADAFFDVVPSSNSDEGVTYQSIADAKSEAVAKIMFAESEADANANIDALVAESDRLGMDNLRKYMTNRLNENLKKLGEE